MAKLGIDFEWTRASRTAGSAYEVAEGKIRQLTTGRTRFRPLEEHEALYLIFAHLDGSPEACLSFAQTWGLLTTPAQRGAAESVDYWRREIKEMNAWLLRVSNFKVAGRIRAKLTTIDVALEFGMPDVSPALLLKPNTLLGAMLVQFAQSEASGNSLHRCAQCGNWFERGGRGGKNRRRSISVFCSESCKNKHHYERRMEQ